MKKMTSAVQALAVACTFALSSSLALAADWQLPGPIKLMIGFAAGGGADTQARLIAEEIEASTGSQKPLPAS